MYTVSQEFMGNDTMRQYHERRLHELMTLRTPWEAEYEEIDRLLVPGYVRLNPHEQPADTGIRRRVEVVDNAAQLAHRIFRSGMQSGMTSRARPWFNITARDRDVRENPAVKIPLAKLTEDMREVFDKSNLYNTFHDKYGSLGAVGTGVSYLSADPLYVVRNTFMLAGTYWIAVNHNGHVDTLYHIDVMTAQQIIGKFNRPGDKVPQQVREAYDKGDRDRKFLVYHAMEPRHHRDVENPTQKHMPYLSNYWMREDENINNLLRESGSRINRVIASRWDAIGLDPYGYGLGSDVLSNLKRLQHGETRKMEVLDKTTRPPMVGPTALKNKRHSLLPGSITYSDEVHKMGGYRQAIDVSRYNLDPLRQDLQDMRERIEDIYHKPLFMAISSMQGVQPRNEFELAERKEEKLLQLGPALERLQTEELQPTIAGVYHYMKEAGMTKALPEEMENSEGDIAVQYTSIMAQAQKAVGVGSIERLGGFVGNIAAIKPDVMDKYDTDQAVDEYADKIGAPPSIVVSDEQVAKLRAKREEQMQQERAMAQMAEAAPAAKQGAEAAALMSQIDDTTGDPTRLLDELGLGGSAGY